MADIDWGHFAAAFKTRLTALGLGRNSAAAAWPATSTAMISRACSAKRLSAGSFLLLCSLAELDPFEFLQVARARRVTLAAIRKSLADQTGTAGVQRETIFASRAEGAPAGRASGHGARSGARPAAGQEDAP